ncbi:MAG: hypothetical protein NTY19_00815 [Planctomycetota bacterium]|nr:hypothetical protein [Planctomycetota bacterium]
MGRGSVRMVPDGVVAITKKAKEELGRDIFMVLGGTHLLNHSDEDLQRVVDDLKGLGVQKVGATHCSGEKAIVKMTEGFGDGFVRMGVGRIAKGPNWKVGFWESCSKQAGGPDIVEIIGCLHHHGSKRKS